MQAPSQPAEGTCSQQRHIEYDIEYQKIYISPPCAKLESMLQSERLTPQEDGEDGYGLSRKRYSLLNQANGFANAGLAPIAAYALLQRGIEVRLGKPHVRPLAVSGGEHDGVCRNPHVLRFLRENSHGVIRHRLGIEDVFGLCSEIAQTLSQPRIAFAAASTPQGKALHAHLSAHREPVTWTDSGRCLQPGARLTVGTFSGFGQLEVVDDPIDILFALDAPQAIGEVGQLAMLANGRSRLFGFLHQDQGLSPYTRDLILAAFGPGEVTVPRLGWQQRQMQTAWLRVDGPLVHDHLTGYGLYRQGIERHPLRNRRIANLAKALVAGDHLRAHQLCSSIPPSGESGSNATAVLVNGVAHGLELAECLPGWSLLPNEPVSPTGLTNEQNKRLVASRSVPMNLRQVIVTMPALNQINLLDFDSVIWAAGASGLPDVPREQLVCPAWGQRPLTWIDVRDGQHGELRRHSRLRDMAYLAAGWFPIGQDPIVGRIKRFLAQRPGSNV